TTIPTTTPTTATVPTIPFPTANTPTISPSPTLFIPTTTTTTIPTIPTATESNFATTVWVSESSRANPNSNRFFYSTTFGQLSSSCHACQSISSPTFGGKRTRNTSANRTEATTESI